MNNAKKNVSNASKDSKRTSMRKEGVGITKTLVRSFGMDMVKVIIPEALDKLNRFQMALYMASVDFTIREDHVIVYLEGTIYNDISQTYISNGELKNG